MAAGSEYLQYTLEQLAGLRDVTSRRMFGGFGLYCGAQFFALVFGDTLYFKVGDASREDYESRGMRRFQPYRDKPYLSMSYYEVPAEVLEDAEELVVWARRAVDAALSDAARKKPATRNKRTAKKKRAPPSATVRKKRLPS
jgi:DNA transformation protein and related proteins